MDRGSILSGAAFRTALLSAMVFLTVLLAIGTTAFFYVQRMMIAELEAQIIEEQLLFRDIYDGGGPQALEEVIKNLDQPLHLKRRVIGLFGTRNEVIAGNIIDPPDYVGWRRTDLKVRSETGAGNAVSGSTLVDEYYINATTIGEVTVVIGRNMDLLEATEKVMIRTLSLAGFIVVLSMLATGYFASRQTLRKLEGIEATLDRISQGDTGVRLAVSDRNDQIDRISHRINTHLDRLGKLMIGTRATAAVIAHDLKSPLTRAFLGLEQALALAENGKDPRDAIEASQAELTHLNAIFETVLRIVRIEAGEGRAGFTSVDLGQLVDELAETFSTVAEENGQTLSASRSDMRPFTLRADARMLQQMIVNLLQNAINHCPAGTSISIDLTRSGDNIQLIVADTGPGILPEDRDHVFVPFFRGAADRADKGSGLGLSLVKSVADRHGASINLSDNAPGLKVSVTFA